MKQTLFYTLLLIFPIFFLSCTDDPIDEPGIDKLDVDLLTGLQFRDLNGELIGKVGNLNTKNLEATFYPNPVEDIFSIFSTQEIQTIWLAPAVVSMDFQEVDYFSELTNLDYSRDEVEQIQIRTIDAAGNNTITIDVGDITAGYYRVFYEFNSGQIGWDNIYIDPNTAGNISYEFLLSEWQ